MTTSRTTQSKKLLLDFLKLNATDKDVAAILADYANGLVSIQDGTIQSIMQANAVTEFTLFEPRNEKRDGIYTLSKSQLDKGIGFIVTGFSLQAYQATDTNGGVTTARAMTPGSDVEVQAMLDADKFAIISAIPALCNGELEIRINRKPVLNKLSLQNFNNSAANSNNVGSAGYYALDNPIFIKPEVPIEALIRTAVATPASTLVEVMFYGAATLAT